METGESIGRIVRLQVQTVPIKRSKEGYFPEHILPVETASIDTWGMIGWTGSTWVIDAHHKAHPSQRAGGRRPLSVGFTGHYDAMADRFGSAPAGIAGENILIDGDALALDDLGDGLVVTTRSGEDVILERPRVAAPCVEFTSFMLHLDHVAPLDEIRGPLAELDDGRRGFIVAADRTPHPIEIAVGDEVFLVAST
jgi:MOSC domain